MSASPRFFKAPFLRNYVGTRSTPSCSPGPGSSGCESRCLGPDSLAAAVGSTRTLSPSRTAAAVLAVESRILALFPGTGKPKFHQLGKTEGLQSCSRLCNGPNALPAVTRGGPGGLASAEASTGPELLGDIPGEIPKFLFLEISVHRPAICLVRASHLPPSPAQPQQHSRHPGNLLPELAGRPWTPLWRVVVFFLRVAYRRGDLF